MLKAHRPAMMIALAALFAVPASAVTTTSPSPAAAEIAQLRERVKQLEAENAKLKIELAGRNTTAASQPAAQTTKMITLESFFEGYPKDKMPTADERNSLKVEALTRWIENERVGHSITVTTLWKASGVNASKDEISVHIEREIAGRDWNVLCELATSDPDALLAIKDGSQVQITGKIKMAVCIGKLVNVTLQNCSIAAVKKTSK